MKRKSKFFITMLLINSIFNLSNSNITAHADSSAVNMQFLKSVGGSKDDFFNSVKPTKDGGCIAVGHSFSQDGDMNSISKGCDCAIISKFDAKGNIQWIKTFGGSDETVFKSVEEANNGDYIVVGYSDCRDGDLEDYNSYANTMNSLNKGQEDGIIVDYSSDGKQQWVQDIGGSGTDEFNFIQKCPNGFVITGYTTSTDKDMTNNPNSYGSNVIVKLNQSGYEQSINFIKTSNTIGSQENINATLQNKDGSYVAVGYTSSLDSPNSLDNAQGLIEKSDYYGNVKWVKAIGGSGFTELYSVQPTKDGGYIAAGVSTANDGDLAGLNKENKDAILVKFDTNGNIQWLKTFGGSNDDEFYFAKQTKDDGYIAVGYASSYDGDLSGIVQDILNSSGATMVKYDSDGNVQWVKDIGTNGSDKFYSVDEAKDGGYIAAGASNDNLDINHGSYDAIIARFDSNIVTNPKAPTLVEDTSSTNGTVKVTISYPQDSSATQYKIGDNGIWTNYTVPIVLKQNATVYARYCDLSRTFSNIGSLVVSNIQN